MNTKSMQMAAGAAISLIFLGGVALAAQDRYTVKVPDGLAFSEFKGYESWTEVAPSVTESSVKSILANPIMGRTYAGTLAIALSVWITSTVRAADPHRWSQPEGRNRYRP